MECENVSDGRPVSDEGSRGQGRQTYIRVRVVVVSVCEIYSLYQCSYTMCAANHNSKLD